MNNFMENLREQNAKKLPHHLLEAGDYEATLLDCSWQTHSNGNKYILLKWREKSSGKLLFQNLWYSTVGSRARSNKQVDELKREGDDIPIGLRAKLTVVLRSHNDVEKNDVEYAYFISSPELKAKEVEEVEVDDNDYDLDKFKTNEKIEEISKFEPTPEVENDDDFLAELREVVS